ncbi:uncharacterized protein LOC126837347 [Adelges cooleyi]|uniref:uncharacterized protein LOC126837347 n=1 Tax=Adelges cooleyi TaxID=133065 RepID=UPI00217F57FC|nr:uncharacterized protein LOC126837347 [Adelges cooleyi]
MFSKIIILFFWVVLYFLQCQGTGPNEETRQIIENIVRDHYKPNGLSYKELRHVIDEVTRKTGAKGNIPSRDRLEKRLEVDTYSKAEVVSIVRYIVGDDSMTELVRELFEKNQYPSRINFVHLGYMVQSVRMAKGMDTPTDNTAQLKMDIINNRKRMFHTMDESDIIDFIINNLNF